MFPRPVCLTHANVVAENGLAASVRFERRILSVGEPPKRGDRVIDLAGAFVLPGLINAHDHLELNHFGRVKYRAVYGNAAEWIEDMRPQLQTDPRLWLGQTICRADRLFVGGLKNLLAGVTTVAHHNPLYGELRLGFPIRVVTRFGWAHSLYLDEKCPLAKRPAMGAIARRYRSTPRALPFIVHVAEGTDPAAAAELAELEARGCVGQNLVLVHGVALSAADWQLLARRGAGLVWCPASNLFLLGKTIALRERLDPARGAAPRLALGTDSRLTGSRDLLSEIRVAAECQAAPEEILAMVTTQAAQLLRLPAAGRIAAGLAADLVILPPLAQTASRALLAAERKDIWLTLVGGRPAYGAPEAGDVFLARGVMPQPVSVDGRPKLLARTLARRLEQHRVGEPGVGPWDTQAPGGHAS